MVAKILLRRSFGVLRIVFGVLILVSMYTQISDLIVHDAFTPGEYFAFFTIESSLLNIVALIAAGWYAITRPHDTEILTIVRMSIFAYAVVTGIVYAALLRGGPPAEGYAGPEWPNEVMHVVLPVFIAVDWFFAPGRQTLSWRRLGYALIFPLVWLVFTIVRGLIIDWFPYFFVDPTNSGGWPAVLLYSAGIFTFVIVVSSVAILSSRLGRSRIPARE